MSLPKAQFIKQIHPNLSLQQINEIPVIVLDHAVGKAMIALQGAHLLSWQPHFAAQDIFWLSEIEPFKLGAAIRGGIPVCYPWFKDNGSPAHGYARINLWQLSQWQICDDQVELNFTLYDRHNLVEAEVKMTFSAECRLSFTHYGEQEAQLALHSYFNVGDIAETTLHGLPKTALNTLNNQQENVPSPRQFDQETDCIYSAENPISRIEDKAQQRTIEIEHINASDIVVWNPWHKKTSSMSQSGYQTMLCVETSRIRRRLVQGESVQAIIRLVR
ncbi:D-hexose-6-phosphate mutarotase [Testudinibacter aquarius]|uniref:Putative glucose-6-phosphate 1-epimerase n=1 Tax=Testudinibacter aquarius TaxID=1524974 RepID=A0A4R3Y452_9PAST|nr:D-hexose-6-phosphate mutarotase [Testudinibacter aquarius]KAE9527515.1 D-hexose-6-phosphate mutarotase [Testudinibacter aquarius]TCV86457.1 glucose-6-phosphate 1-epimerase [Testudinibacter aquarius]TNG91544.1 D-hexose-6-phosphate mutarotase [Testudinibacter aquarius]